RRGFYSRGATVLVLFAWLAVIGLVRLEKRWIAAALYLGVGLLVALKFRSGAAATVWALGAGAFALQLLTLARARSAIAAAAAAACLATPLLVKSFPAPDAQHAAARSLPSSWSHRIVIWQFAAAKIAERPVLGWGLDASRKIPGGRETIPWQMDPDPNDAGDRMSVVQRLPLHPHSVSLQLWLELGATGAALLAALAFLLVRSGGVDRAERWPHAGCVALACSGLAIANVSYGAWQTWWLSTLFMVAAAALLLARRREAP
ncbi:MAG: O-antigen ligase family protein, partial [Rhodospirillales bacterium]|nr:O-antigen ligase family protein [Rhodospirillales bacterium]